MRRDARDFREVVVVQGYPQAFLDDTALDRTELQYIHRDLFGFDSHLHRTLHPDISAIDSPLPNDYVSRDQVFLYPTPAN